MRRTARCPSDQLGCRVAALVRVPPGPTSTSTRAGSASSASTSSANLTVARICLAHVAGLVASLADIHVPVTLDISGICGALSVNCERKLVNSATTPSINREWNACEVRTLRAAMPCSDSRAEKAAIALSEPATTQLPGSFTVAMSTSPSRSAAISAGPRGTATITPRGAAFISRARIATALTAVGRSKTPAMVAAAYSPMLCPASADGSTPRDWASLASAYSTANNAGWVRSVRSSVRGEPSMMSARRSMPSSASKRVAAAVKCSAKTGSDSMRPRAIPTCCEPCPGNRNAMRSPLPSTAGAAEMNALSCSSARRMPTASAVSLTTAARRNRSVRRPARVWATSAMSRSGRRSRSSASARRPSANESAVRADSVTT
ncbi:Uncharacterised protein [Mycobacteroides abscessus subsp. abscessus]|nr:Uncharacterised protein [Mycobacteroides abscessus subsp. abscessus]